MALARLAEVAAATLILAAGRGVDRLQAALLGRASRLWHRAHAIVWLAAVHDGRTYRDRKAREAARMMTKAQTLAAVGVFAETMP